MTLRRATSHFQAIGGRPTVSSPTVIFGPQHRRDAACRPRDCSPCRPDDAQALACAVGGGQSCLLEDLSARASRPWQKVKPRMRALPIGTTLSASTGTLARRNLYKRVRGGLVAALGVVLGVGFT